MYKILQYKNKEYFCYFNSALVGKCDKQPSEIRNILQPRTRGMIFRTGVQPRLIITIYLLQFTSD